MATQIIICVSAHPPVADGLALPELFARQPGTSVCVGARPFLVWPDGSHSGADDSLLKSRIERIKRATDQSTIVDVGSFYLPYISQLIGLYPDVKLVYLKCDEADVMSAFERHFASLPLPFNYWISKESDAYFVDPDWGRAYPKFELDDRQTASQKYAHLCDSMADAAATTYSKNMQIVTVDDLRSEASVSQLLSFCGMSQHVIHVHDSEALPWPAPHARQKTSADDTASCVVLVPHANGICPATEDTLRELEQKGYTVWRRGGVSAIDQARSQLATEAMLSGFTELMWIDSDIKFSADAVQRLRSHNLPIVAGVYPKKGVRSLASTFEQSVEEITFGDRGGLVETDYIATGFLLVRRNVLIEMIRRCPLPACNELFNDQVLFPFFLPEIVPHHDSSWYLGEDFAFSNRARRCGYTLYSDTTIRLWHIGTYEYGWEDAGRDVVRYDNYLYRLKKQEET